MQISPVDVTSDLALRACFDLERRAVLVGREDMPHWSWPEMAAVWQLPDPGERAVLLDGTEDGRVVAVAMLFMPLLDNTDKCWLGVAVEPADQGRGLGREMLDAVCALAVAEGRTELLAEVKLPFDEVASHRARRFAEAAGFTLSNVEVVRHLRLPVPTRDLEAWAGQAAPRHDGYRLETYLDEVPDDLVPSLCVLLGQLAVDAPTGEAEWEEELITPERYRENQRSLVAAGRRIYETVAIAPDGTVAAQSTISVPPAGGRTDASQWGTFVHREHRGRRLGLAVKAANLRTVQEAHPEMRRIVTQNAETNDHMVSINELMGFEPVEASVELIKRV
ncbi:GNAT family N-acetyltransferase [Nocardioides dongxiaopingii]|uniref:GNAT family N-acetyltransferase n=1 Tax=Nocardioides dongxiaopingii TaxID=2576036 RepID=UPI0010C76390|nr:GNAT family N-acetyltransferase [Nocardioides dongxiaopingii]